MLRLLLLLLLTRSVLAQESLTGPAAALFGQAREQGRFYAGAERLRPELRPTSDGRSFVAIWRAKPKPKRWIVSLHGAGHPARGFATDDLALWAPCLKDRDVGLICLQWWLGTGSARSDFYTPEQIERELEIVLEELGVRPGEAMLHGFSRGAANLYAVKGLDQRRYFRLVVASSGAMEPDYPPNRAIPAGALRGTRWITVAGARDPNPDRSGVSGMRRTARWLREQHACVVLEIEDPQAGHGALFLNPDNVRKVLDLFLEDS